MKLSVSNIAWNQDEDTAALNLLKHHNASGVEIAPTRLWPNWTGMTHRAAVEIRSQYAEMGFAIPALQAILFNRPDLRVFDDAVGQDALLKHIDDVAGIGALLGAGSLVFGSPRNRDPGDRTAAQAHAEAVKFFLRAAERCHAHGVQLCLEPNPKVYGCRFMTHWQDVRAIVDDVGHAGLGIHLDTACISMEGDDVVEAIHACAGRIAHFHISEPELSDFSTPRIDHASIGRTLRDIAYDGWLSIEMKRSTDPLASIDRALDCVTTWYNAEESP